MQPPRGTRDFGPAEMAQRRALEGRLRAILATYNYHEVQTPAFEELELFLAKSGPGVREELYEFKDKSGRELALRPELTAPVMRFYFSSLKMEPKPLRLFYMGPCYRYDRPQAGRYREFWQFGCELLGDDSPEAHAELLRLALALFDGAGLKNYVLRLGHLGILRSLLEQAGVPRAEQPPLMRLIDKKDLDGLKRALDERRAGTSARVLKFFEMKHIDELKPLASTPEASAALAHLSRILDVLATLGADTSRIQLDPTIARGLEYYTGLVFELDAPDLGAEKQLLGGGAYDLSGVFQDQAVAAVGFALGFDRTLVALERAGLAVAAVPRVDAVVAALAPEAWTAAAELAQRIRSTGSSVELVSQPAQIKKLLGRASQTRARHALFMGPKELERGVVAVKDLDAQTQIEVPLAEAVDLVTRTSRAPR